MAPPPATASPARALWALPARQRSLRPRVLARPHANRRGRNRGDRRDHLLSRPAVQTVSDRARPLLGTAHTETCWPCRTRSNGSSPRAAQSLNPQAAEHSCLKESRNRRIEVIQTVANLFAVHRYVPSTVAAEGRRSLTRKIRPSSTHVDDLVYDEAGPPQLGSISLQIWKIRAGNLDLQIVQLGS